MKKYIYSLVKKLALYTTISTLLISFNASAKTEIVFWHAMGGRLGQLLDKIVADFNNQSKDFTVKSVFKGDYDSTMNSAIASIRVHHQPTLVQIFDAGTATMLGFKQYIKPLYKMFDETKIKFDSNNLIDAVKSYYTDTEGKLYSMPFNSSTAVLYYNKDLFRKAGLDPNKPPRTWTEYGTITKKLVDSGAAKCGATTSYMFWVNFENYAAINNTPYATNHNGYDGAKGTRLNVLNKPFANHLKRLYDLSKHNKAFTYMGRNSEPQKTFEIGECAILAQSSGSRGALENLAKFDLGMSFLPYDDKITDHIQNSIIGGASIWALQGKSNEEYKGAAKFLAYLSSDKTQQYWSKNSGYVTITKSGYKALQDEGFFKQNPNAEIAFKQLTMNKPTKNSLGMRLGYNPQIRVMGYEEVEKLFNDKQSLEQTLKNFKKRADSLLQKFEKLQK